MMAVADAIERDIAGGSRLVDDAPAIERRCGELGGVGPISGPPSLSGLCAAWEDVQRTRLALDQRALGIETKPFRLLEEQLSRQIRRQLETHPVWPWLSQYPGLGGVHVARLVALIGDPHRFPGRQCAAGHYHPARVGDRIEGDDLSGPCGIPLEDGGACPATLGPARRGTGTRSLWRYLGLDVVDGHSPRKQKGSKAHWNPTGRTMVLMPGGIAEHIVRSRVPHYRDLYDQKKERLQSRAVTGAENGPTSGLRPFQIDAIARKWAVKQFIADLLQAMKRAM